MTLEMKVKRGETSWNYFNIAFGILLAIVLAIISVLNISPPWKALMIIVSAIILFYFCFFNTWFRNKIVGVMNKSKEKIEKYKA